MEEELKSSILLVAIVRPSILLGKRNEYRLGESIGFGYFERLGLYCRPIKAIPRH